MGACSCHVRFLCPRSAPLVVSCCTGRLPGLNSAGFRPGTQLGSSARFKGLQKLIYSGWTRPCLLPGAQARLQALGGTASCLSSSKLHIHKSKCCNFRSQQFLLRWSFTSNKSIPCCQGVTLEPLASFLEPVWNKFNVLPMRVWLSTSTETDPRYRDRMRTLGNIVVPQTGALGMNILQRLRIASTA